MSHFSKNLLPTKLKNITSESEDVHRYVFTTEIRCLFVTDSPISMEEDSLDQRNQTFIRTGRQSMVNALFGEFKQDLMELRHQIHCTDTSAAAASVESIIDRMFDIY